MFRKIRRSHFVMGLIGLVLGSSFAWAQETKSPQSLSVTAAAASERVRFAAPGEVVQMNNVGLFSIQNFVELLSRKLVSIAI